MKTLSFISRTGAEISTFSDDFAALRITVFREFPYLYEGSMEYEKNYLQTYAQSDSSMMFAVFDEGRMIGATTCLALKDETEEVQRPFHQAGIDVSPVFYFGESLLLPEYRGLGIGHRFFDKREAHAKSFGTYQTTSFCAVVRPQNHPLKPKHYRTNDAFWRKRGYRKNENLKCTMSWLDRDETAPSPKELVFWTRDI